MSTFNIEFIRHAFNQGQYARSCILKTNETFPHNTWQNVKTNAVPDVEFEVSKRIKKIAVQFDYTEKSFCIGEETFFNVDNFEFAEILRILNENQQNMHILKIMELMFYVGHITAIQKYWPETENSAVFQAFEKNNMRDLSCYIVIKMIFE
jgi:hypothetical protein